MVISILKAHRILSYRLAYFKSIYWSDWGWFHGNARDLEQKESFPPISNFVRTRSFCARCRCSFCALRSSAASITQYAPAECGVQKSKSLFFYCVPVMAAILICFFCVCVCLSVCLSVRLSVCHVMLLCLNESIFFSVLVGPSVILDFSTQLALQSSNGKQWCSPREQGLVSRPRIENLCGIFLDDISTREQFAFLVYCYRVKTIFHNLCTVLYWDLYGLTNSPHC